MTPTPAWWIPEATPIPEVTPIPTLTVLSEFERRVLELVNIERARYELDPLVWDSRLADAARAHSEDMARNNLPIGHTGSDNSGVRERVNRAGISWLNIAENVIGGFETPEAMVARWMNSLHHRANILHEQMTHLGVGIIQLEGSRYNIYATQKFARLATTEEPPPQPPEPPVPPPQPPVPPSVPTGRGNSPGNFAGGSLAAFTNNYIFFSNTADFQLWKMDYNGENRQRIGNFRLPSDFQYHNGWVYFSYNNGQNIVRMNATNPTEYRRLIDRQQTGQIFCIKIFGGQLYFSTNQGIFRLTNGTPEQILASTGSWRFTLTENEIINSPSDNYGNLYRYSWDGTRLNIIAQDAAHARVIVHDGWIIFNSRNISQFGGSIDQIVKVRPDGTERQVIRTSRVPTWEPVIHVGSLLAINFDDGWVYFWDVYDVERVGSRYNARIALCRIRLDGTGFSEVIRDSQLRNQNSSFRGQFAIHNGYAYVIANNHDFNVGNSELYRVPITGGSVELLARR